jgi:predicted site-specific integrase-resolvase
MKSNEVLRLLGITRPTLTKYVKKSWIKVEKMKNGRYWYDSDSVNEFMNRKIDRKIVVYARVSTSNQRKDLDNQIELLKKYCFSNGYQLNAVYKDIASGINFDQRTDFFKLLDEVFEHKIEKIIITYKDRLSRIAFGFFEKLFEKFGTKIEVISEVGNAKLDSEEIFEEIVHLIHAFSMKLYSSRRGKKIEIIEKE